MLKKIDAYLFEENFDKKEKFGYYAILVFFVLCFGYALVTGPIFL